MRPARAAISSIVVMVLAAAAGFARVLGPKSRAMTGCLAGFGAAMLAAAVFPAD